MMAMQKDTARVAPEFLARVRFDEPMSRHTSWHAGGPADIFFAPRDMHDLAAFLRQLPASMPVYWLGLGSNILVRDGGLRGAVISTHGALGGIERISQTRVAIQAGVPCARIAKQCVKWGLGSAEFFAGIPGTLGGALAMNAGAFGGETWTHVVDVEVMDRQGRRTRRARSEYEVSYRQVRVFDGECFVAASLEFDTRAPRGEAGIRELLEKRRATQPIGEWSCGSVFTNPSGDHAARLIDAAGLKGWRIGDASVSDKHANFIINHGKASAADLEALILHVQAVVAERFSVRLLPEVRILGEAS
jgi:UDP-N-acetylmuramate dehydrogenase